MRKKIVDDKLFREGNNPYHRICNKCGAHQVQYGDGFNYSWWEEVYPIGNDENCKCHKKAEYY